MLTPGPLKTNEACVSPDTAVSNMITMTVNSVTPSITISGTNSVSGDSIVLVTSKSIGGGSYPGFQWQDSTATHSWQDIHSQISSGIYYLPADDGDKIRCRLISDAKCTTFDSVYSNILSFKIIPRSSPIPFGEGIRIYPNPVITSLTLDSLKAEDQWQTLTITSLNGMQHLLLKNIEGLTKVTVDISTFEKGAYFIILTNKEGKQVQIEFIKL